MTDTTSDSLLNPASSPGEAAGVYEEMIHRLVHSFYAKVRADPTLGPVFDGVIGDRWDEHLPTMCDFWSSVTLTTARSKGSPMLAHVPLPRVPPPHVDRCLPFFR